MPVRLPPGRGLEGERIVNTAGSDDQVHLESHQLPRQGRRPFVLALGRPKLDDEVPAFHVAQLAELLLEGVWRGRGQLSREEPDAIDLLRRLCVGGERHRGEAANEGAENSAADPF
jgi:hypothetical protein